MLIDLPAALVVLAGLIDTAKSEVRIATQALASPVVLAAIDRARARSIPVKVVLGASAEYTLDSKGQPTGPNRPYDKGPQGMELARLDAAGADTYIPPRFNEIGASEYRPGVTAHMTYAVIDQTKGLLCTTSFSTGAAAGLCTSMDNAAQAQALRGLHTVDHDYTLLPLERARLMRALAPADLIASPEASADVVLLLKQPWTTIYTALLSDGPALIGLLQSPARPDVWLNPGAPHSRGAITQLRAAGFQVRFTSRHFDGTVLLSPKMVFIGSQRLDSEQLEKSRDVGVLLPAQVVSIAIQFTSVWHQPVDASRQAAPRGTAR